MRKVVIHPAQIPSKGDRPTDEGTSERGGGEGVRLAQEVIRALHTSTEPTCVRRVRRVRACVRAARAQTDRQGLSRDKAARRHGEIDPSRNLDETRPHPRPNLRGIMRETALASAKPRVPRAR